MQRLFAKGSLVDCRPNTPKRSRNLGRSWHTEHRGSANTAPIEARASEILERANAAAAQIDALRGATTDQAQRTLAEVRKVAAEAGVSQQATYFDAQANKHSEQADAWQTRTYWTAGVLAVFALAAGVIGYFVVPVNAYQAAQFAISKLLIFSTIAFMLYLSSRTLMAHRHNEVVNRHRQNALLTFNALADAATTEQTRDIVLTHASQCIFAPQESGFSKGAGPQSAPSMVEIVPKVMGAEHIGG